MSTLYVNTINPKTGTAVKTAGSISGSSNLSIGGNVEASGSVLAAGYLIANNEAQLKAGATVSGTLDAKVI